MPNKVARKEQAQNTKKKLLETAITLFKKHGYEKVTIEQICREADVTTGAFYHHLKSKAGVIVEGYAEYDEFVKTKFDAILEQNLSCGDKVLHCIDLQSQFALDLGVEAIIEIYKTQITEDQEFFLDKDRSIVSIINNIVKQAQELGEISKEANPESITDEILIVSRGVIYNWCQHKGNYDLKDVSRRVVSHFLEGYRPLLIEGK